MFISSKEKLSLTLRVTVLEGRIEQLARSLNAVLDAQTMASDPAGLKPQKPRKKYTTEQQRVKRRAYAKKYYDKKKAEQAQAEITPTAN
jgi:hypothetical protein